MAAAIHLSISTPSPNFRAPCRTLPPLHPPMTIAKFQPLRHLSRRILRRGFSVSAAAVRQDTTLWTPAPLLKISPAAESLFNITIDVSDSPELAGSYTKAGQYLQLRLQDPDTKPAFLAIASPPSTAASKGVFEFLIKSAAGSTAELLCGLQKGDVVELTLAMGKGFNIDQISPPENYQTVVIFATGSGIRFINQALPAVIPIRSLIEAGFNADKRSNVRLYYGARSLGRMAYQERFKDWESSGVDIVPVLSQPDDSWKGERGYVQAAFKKEKNIISPQSTGAVLCGQKQMAEEVTSLLVADGVSTEKILKNF
ncbi:Na(+)-translocating NADH-quinone reductasesubunit F [Striga asiatica]|uniref:Na(+)-translocating NADH-quinone reductasesubunit F n=1 Tax=Striga asiatica TaxID=4170 RepID=A0A5A7PBP4_STRAF|nr:Na(+)-translocating NADH-quinone reductasesubunit F [Striga asiatica]